MKNTAGIGLLFAFLACSCNQSPPYQKRAKPSAVNFPFNLESPDKKFKLPEQLYEISGVTAVDDSIVACIADEKGVIYFYNLNKGVVERKIKFAGEGDFEDLTIIGDTIYVLDSKGVVWSVKNYNNQLQIQSHNLTIEKPFELEGLSKIKDMLFIAAKYYHNKKGNEYGKLPIWKVTSEIQVKEPLFSIPDLIESPDNPPIPFHTSAIAYDEVSRQWYCLSTHSKALVQCFEDGKIIAAHLLPNKIFSQPEGMCFTRSNDLLISNEGRDGPASILLFININNR